MTIAVYQKQVGGMVRLGTFTPKSKSSVRSISGEFKQKHPNADMDTIFFMQRRRLMGKWVDCGEMLPAENE